MGARNLGILDWSGKQTDKGHREYEITWLIETNNTLDGPWSVGYSGALARVGSLWAYGNDLDLWAFCMPDLTLTPVAAEGSRGFLWHAKQRWSTEHAKRDQTTPPGNPLLEPPDISGSFVTYTKEATQDRDGKAILSSSLEKYKGSVVEVDASKHSVSIKLNVATLPFAALQTMMHTTNLNAMWGLPANTIKLSNMAWSRKYYSTNLAAVYYAATYDFDIDFETYTRKILDEGTRTLRPGGVWADKKVQDYVPYGDKVILNGVGAALTNADTPYYHSKELYKQSNLLTLGIPAFI